MAPPLSKWGAFPAPEFSEVAPARNINDTNTGKLSNKFPQNNISHIGNKFSIQFPARAQTHMAGASYVSYCISFGYVAWPLLVEVAADGRRSDLLGKIYFYELWRIGHVRRASFRGRKISSRGSGKLFLFIDSFC